MKSIKNQQWNPNLVKDCWRYADWGVADFKMGENYNWLQSNETAEIILHTTFKPNSALKIAFFSILESLINQNSAKTLALSNSEITSIHRLMQFMNPFQQNQK